MNRTDLPASSVLDRVLVLDVSRHRYPPVWAPIPALHAAMNTPVGQTTRGYAIVSRAG